MGLENFTDDDVSSTSSGSTKDVGRSEQKPNSPTSFNQSFNRDKTIPPREIKFQAKTVNLKWNKQFSTRRCKDGELVLHARDFSDSGSQVVCVFTTIRAFDSEYPYDQEQLDIWVVPWDLDNNEMLSSGTSVSADSDEWKDEMIEAITRTLGEIE